MRRLPLRKSALILFDKGANDLAIMGDKDLTPLSEVQKDSKQVCVIYHSIPCREGVSKNRFDCVV
jgi:hypothetical protein